MARQAKVPARVAAAMLASDQHQLIAEEIATFLESGGEIQQIPRGVSGMPRMGGAQTQRQKTARS